MSDVVFEYRLQAGGRAEFALTFGYDRVQVITDRGSNPLAHLIDAALSIAKQDPRVELYLPTQNGFTSWWEFTQVSKAVQVQVIEVRQPDGGQSGGLLVKQSCSVHAFCSAIANGAAAVYDRHGLHGYLNLSASLFPTEPLAELEALVETAA